VRHGKCLEKEMGSLVSVDTGFLGLFIYTDNPNLALIAVTSDESG